MRVELVVQIGVPGTKSDDDEAPRGIPLILPLAFPLHPIRPSYRPPRLRRKNRERLHIIASALQMFSFSSTFLYSLQ